MLTAVSFAPPRSKNVYVFEAEVLSRSLYFAPALKASALFHWCVSLMSACLISTRPSNALTGRPGTVFGVVV